MRVPLKLLKHGLENRRRHVKANQGVSGALNVSLSNSLWWLIYIINLVDNMTLSSYTLLPTQHYGSFRNNFEKVHLLNREIIILGDFNIDFLGTKKCHKRPLVKAMRNLNMSRLVRGITRPVSKTSLDHIWGSHPEGYPITSQLLLTGDLHAQRTMEINTLQ